MKKTLILLVALFFVACTENKQEANDKNFKEAVNRYNSNNCVLFNGNYTNNLPVNIELQDEKKGKYAKEYNKSLTHNLDYFVKIGLLNVKDLEVDKKKMFGKGTFKQKIKTYDLTPKGKKYYSSSNVRNMSGYSKKKGFCLGKYRVDEILNFTEPTNAFEKIVSTVKFSRTLVDIPDFVKTEEFKKFYEKNNYGRKLFDYKKTETMPLILTKKGWYHPSYLQ